jgi:hypothetical protein
MGKAIATLSCVLITDNATAQATIITPPSAKVKAGSFCYFGNLQVQVVGATQGSLVQNAPMTGTITATGVKVKSFEGQAVLENDKTLSPVMCPAIDTSSGAAGVIAVTVTIQNAGQTKAMAT